MEMKRYLLTKSNNTRRMEKKNKIEYIVITSSRYKNFSALKNRNIIEKLKYKTDIEFSCNYIIGGNGDILNIIPDKETSICTHDVNIDERSISIMLAINDKGEYTTEEIISLKKLLKKLIKKYDIKKENVLREYDINNSRRPILYVEEPILFNELIYN